VRLGTLRDGQVLVVHHVSRPDNSLQALDFGTLLPVHKESCVMSEPARGRELLDAAAVAERLQRLAGWTLEDGKLRKSYAFPNFVAAVSFVDRLTIVAEAQNHHPDLSVGWGKVIVHLWSHDVGGITSRDFRLAAAIDEL
jgi:4a-hydroxytetrahydrobiopterin dehydratase